MNAKRLLQIPAGMLIIVVAFMSVKAGYVDEMALGSGVLLSILGGFAAALAGADIKDRTWFFQLWGASSGGIFGTYVNSVLANLNARLLPPLDAFIILIGGILVGSQLPKWWRRLFGRPKSPV